MSDIIYLIKNVKVIVSTYLQMFCNSFAIIHSSQVRCSKINGTGLCQVYIIYNKSIAKIGNE